MDGIKFKVYTNDRTQGFEFLPTIQYTDDQEAREIAKKRKIMSRKPTKGEIREKLRYLKDMLIIPSKDDIPQFKNRNELCCWYTGMIKKYL